MKALFYGIGVATLSGLLIGGVLRPTLAEGRIGGPQIALGDSGRRAYGDADAGVTSYPYGVPDYVIGTGEMHSVREFLDLAFAHVGLDANDYVELDPRYLRPAEVDALQADPSKAKRELCWQHTTTFPQLVSIMVDAELDSIERRRQGILRPVDERKES